MNYAVIKVRGVAEPCEKAGDAAAGADEFGENLIKTIRICKWFAGISIYLFIYLFTWAGRLKMITQIELYLIDHVH